MQRATPSAWNIPKFTLIEVESILRDRVANSLTYVNTWKTLFYLTNDLEHFVYFLCRSVITFLNCSHMGKEYLTDMNKFIADVSTMETAVETSRWAYRHKCVPYLVAALKAVLGRLQEKQPIQSIYEEFVRELLGALAEIDKAAPEAYQQTQSITRLQWYNMAEEFGELGIEVEVRRALSDAQQWRIRFEQQNCSVSINASTETVDEHQLNHELQLSLSYIEENSSALDDFQFVVEFEFLLVLIAALHSSMRDPTTFSQQIETAAMEILSAFEKEQAQRETPTGYNLDLSDLKSITRYFFKCLAHEGLANLVRKVHTWCHFMAIRISNFDLLRARSPRRCSPSILTQFELCEPSPYCMEFEGSCSAKHCKLLLNSSLSNVLSFSLLFKDDTVELHDHSGHRVNTDIASFLHPKITNAMRRVHLEEANLATVAEDLYFILICFVGVLAAKDDRFIQFVTDELRFTLLALFQYLLNLANAAEYFDALRLIMGQVDAFMTRQTFCYPALVGEIMGGYNSLKKELQSMLVPAEPPTTTSNMIEVAKVGKECFKFAFHFHEAYELEFHISHKRLSVKQVSPEPVDPSLVDNLSDIVCAWVDECASCLNGLELRVTSLLGMLLFLVHKRLALINRLLARLFPRLEREDLLAVCHMRSIMCQTQMKLSEKLNSLVDMAQCGLLNYITPTDPSVMTDFLIQCARGEPTTALGHASSASSQFQTVATAVTSEASTQHVESKQDDFAFVPAVKTEKIQQATGTAYAQHVIELDALSPLYFYEHGEQMFVTTENFILTDVNAKLLTLAFGEMHAYLNKVNRLLAGEMHLSKEKCSVILEIMLRFQLCSRHFAKSIVGTIEAVLKEMFTIFDIVSFTHSEFMDLITGSETQRVRLKKLQNMLRRVGHSQRAFQEDYVQARADTPLSIDDTKFATISSAKVPLVRHDGAYRVRTSQGSTDFLNNDQLIERIGLAFGKLINRESVSALQMRKTLHKVICYIVAFLSTDGDTIYVNSTLDIYFDQLRTQGSTPGLEAMLVGLRSLIVELDVSGEVNLQKLHSSIDIICFDAEQQAACETFIAQTVLIGSYLMPADESGIRPLVGHFSLSRDLQLSIAAQSNSCFLLVNCLPGQEDLSNALSKTNLIYLLNHLLELVQWKIDNMMVDQVKIDSLVFLLAVRAFECAPATAESHEGTDYFITKLESLVLSCAREEIKEAFQDVWKNKREWLSMDVGDLLGKCINQIKTAAIHQLCSSGPRIKFEAHRLSKSLGMHTKRHILQRLLKFGTYVCRIYTAEEGVLIFIIVNSTEMTVEVKGLRVILDEEVIDLQSILRLIRILISMLEKETSAMSRTTLLVTYMTLLILFCCAEHIEASSTWKELEQLYNLTLGESPRLHPVVSVETMQRIVIHMSDVISKFSGLGDEAKRAVVDGAENFILTAEHQERRKEHHSPEALCASTRHMHNLKFPKASTNSYLLQRHYLNGELSALVSMNFKDSGSMYLLFSVVDKRCFCLMYQQEGWIPNEPKSPLTQDILLSIITLIVGHCHSHNYQTLSTVLKLLVLALVGAGCTSHTLADELKLDFIPEQLLQILITFANEAEIESAQKMLDACARDNI